MFKWLGFGLLILSVTIDLAMVVVVGYIFKHVWINISEVLPVAGILIALVMFILVIIIAESKFTKKDPEYQFTTTDKGQRDITVYSKTDISNLSLISAPEYTHFNLRANFVLYEALAANHEFTNPNILYLTQCKDGVMFIASYVDGKFIQFKYPRFAKLEYLEDSISLGFSIIGIARGLVNKNIS